MSQQIQSALPLKFRNLRYTQQINLSYLDGRQANQPYVNKDTV